MLQGVLTGSPVRTDSVSVYPYSDALASALSFESKFDGRVQLGARDGNVLRVPRRLAPALGLDLRSRNPMGAIGCARPPRTAEQAAMVAETVGLLRAGKDHVVEAPTGFGKTYLGSAVAAAMGEATLIVVHKQDLMDSWRRTLTDLVGVPAASIGIAQADRLEYEGRRFVLGMVQSLMQPGKYPDAFWRHFGLLVLDEVDCMAADCFVRVCQLCPAAHRVGYTATPERSDGKWAVVEAHVGPVMVRGTTVPMRPKVLVERTGWRIPPWVKGATPGKMMGAYVAMGRDSGRNARIASFASSCYRRGRNVLVMSDVIDHLNRLMLAITASGVPGEDVGFYTGEVRREMLAHNANKRVVLATYGMCAKGTDYPRWDALVFATPRAHIKQPLGRILRRLDGKPQPVALDLLDAGGPFRSFGLSRRKEYASLGGEVVEL